MTINSTTTAAPSVDLQEATGQAWFPAKSNARIVRNEAYNLMQALYLQCMHLVKLNTITWHAIPALRKDFMQRGLCTHCTQCKAPRPCVKFSATHTSISARCQ